MNPISDEEVCRAMVGQLLAVGFGDLASSLAEEIGTPLEEFAPSDYLRDLITKDVSDAPSSSAPAAKIRRLELNQPSKSGNSLLSNAITYEVYSVVPLKKLYTGWSSRGSSGEYLREYEQLFDAIVKNRKNQGAKKDRIDAIEKCLDGEGVHVIVVPAPSPLVATMREFVLIKNEKTFNDRQGTKAPKWIEMGEEKQKAFEEECLNLFDEQLKQKQKIIKRADLKELKGLCSVKECDKPKSGRRSLCSAHYSSQCTFEDPVTKERCEKQAASGGKCKEHQFIQCNYVDPDTEEQCEKAALSKGGKCNAHYSGQCTFEDPVTKERCEKQAASGGKCKEHQHGQCVYVDPVTKKRCTSTAEFAGDKKCLSHHRGKCTFEDPETKERCTSWARFANNRCIPHRYR